MHSPLSRLIFSVVLDLFHRFMWDINIITFLLFNNPGLSGNGLSTLASGIFSGIESLRYFSLYYFPSHFFGLLCFWVWVRTTLHQLILTFSVISAVFMYFLNFTYYPINAIIINLSRCSLSTLPSGAFTGLDSLTSLSRLYYHFILLFHTFHQLILDTTTLKPFQVMLFMVSVDLMIYSSLC